MRIQKIKMFLGLAIVASMSTVSILQGVENSENGSFLSIGTAFAQRLDLGLTPGHGGGGGTSCSGATCASANGYNYGLLEHNGSTSCCGVMSTSSGTKGS